MVEAIQGSGPTNPPNKPTNPNAASQLRTNLTALSEFFMKVSANGNLSDDAHFCHQVAASVINATNNAKDLLSVQEELPREIASNIFRIMTQTILTDLGETSLEKAAKEYQEGRGELMHQVLSTFALHPNATEALGRELSLIAHS